MNILRKLKIAKIKKEDFVHFTKKEDIIYRCINNYLTVKKKEDCNNTSITYYFDEEFKYPAFSLNKENNKIKIFNGVYHILKPHMKESEIFDLFVYMAVDKNLLEKNITYSSEV